MFDADAQAVPVRVGSAIRKKSSSLPAATRRDSGLTKIERISALHPGHNESLCCRSVLLHRSCCGSRRAASSHCCSRSPRESRQTALPFASVNCANNCSRTPIRQRELRKQLLAQTPGIPGGRVPNPRVNSRSNLLPGRGAFSKSRLQVPQPPAESDHVFPHQPRFFRKQPPPRKVTPSAQRYTRLLRSCTSKRSASRKSSTAHRISASFALDSPNNRKSSTYRI